MTDYLKMYLTLFNAITDALAQIEKQNYGDAKSTLIAAQQKAEEMYITAQNQKTANPTAASEAMPSARSLPPCCRHTRLTIVRRGCKM